MRRDENDKDDDGGDDDDDFACMCVDDVHAYLLFFAGSGLWERVSIEECGKSSTNSRSSMPHWHTRI